MALTTTVDQGTQAAQFVLPRPGDAKHKHLENGQILCHSIAVMMGNNYIMPIIEPTSAGSNSTNVYNWVSISTLQRRNPSVRELSNSFPIIAFPKHTCGLITCLGCCVNSLLKTHATRLSGGLLPCPVHAEQTAGHPGQTNDTIVKVGVSEYCARHCKITEI